MVQRWIKIARVGWVDWGEEPTCRVAKCHGYDGYIRVKIFRGWGKKSERTHNVTKLGLF